MENEEKSFKVKKIEKYYEYKKALDKKTMSIILGVFSSGILSLDIISIMIKNDDFWAYKLRMFSGAIILFATLSNLLINVGQRTLIESRVMNLIDELDEKNFDTSKLLENDKESILSELKSEDESLDLSQLKPNEDGLYEFTSENSKGMRK